MRLLLASQSQARRQMLAAAGVPFETVAAPLDEEEAKAGLAAAGFEPRDMAEMLAELKAKSVDADAGTLVLGADQVLELDDGTLLSKPVSRENAFAQMQSMRGRTHFLHTSAAIIHTGERVWGTTESVAMRVHPLSDAFINAYLDAEYESVKGCVGAYRIEGRGVQLFEAVEGSHFAILGLPLLPLLACLRERGLLAG